MNRSKNRAAVKNGKSGAWDHLIAAPLKDKKRFWTFLAENLSHGEPKRRRFSERAADQFVRFFGNLFVHYKMGTAANFEEFQDKTKLVLGVTKWMEARTTEPSPVGVPVPDLTKVSPQEKRLFLKRVRSMELGPSIRPQHDPKNEDLEIRFLTGLGSAFGSFTDLQGLAEILEDFGKPLNAVQDLRQGGWPEISEDFIPLDSAIDALSQEERLNLLEKMGRSIGECFTGMGRNMDDILDMWLGDLDLEKDSDLEQVVPRLAAIEKSHVEEILEVLKTTALNEIAGKLDDIQERLVQFEDSQKRFESIHDQIETLTQAYRKQVEFGEIPPLPKVDETSPSKKELTVERERITGTVDPVLFKRFQKERKARGVTFSRMLDIILWKYFDKPALSFELVDEVLPMGTPGTSDRRGKR
ncbi:MAG: hypothetical protein ACLP5H_02295 [Desulfomonilaceae bacterium]